MQHINNNNNLYEMDYSVYAYISYILLLVGSGSIIPRCRRSLASVFIHLL